MTNDITSFSLLTDEITFFCNNNNCIVVSINFDKKPWEDVKYSAQSPTCHECEHLLCLRKHQWSCTCAYYPDIEPCDLDCRYIND